MQIGDLVDLRNGKVTQIIETEEGIEYVIKFEDAEFLSNSIRIKDSLLAARSPEGA